MGTKNLTRELVQVRVHRLHDKCNSSSKRVRVVALNGKFFVATSFDAVCVRPAKDSTEAEAHQIRTKRFGAGKEIKQICADRKNAYAVGDGQEGGKTVLKRTRRNAAVKVQLLLELTNRHSDAQQLSKKFEGRDARCRAQLSAIKTNEANQSRLEKKQDTEIEAVKNIFEAELTTFE